MGYFLSTDLIVIATKWGSIFSRKMYLIIRRCLTWKDIIFITIICGRWISLIFLANKWSCDLLLLLFTKKLLFRFLLGAAIDHVTLNENR